MRCMLPWELRCVLGGNRSESGIIILYSTSEQGYLVLALYKHALLYTQVVFQVTGSNEVRFQPTTFTCNEVVLLVVTLLHESFITYLVIK